MLHDAFHAMRRFISANAGIFQRLDTIERHQIATDQRLDHILDQLEEGTLKQKAHIFSAGQIFEAKSFIESLIGKATTRVILDDQLWHVGASIKDAGVKTFGIDPIGLDPNLILTQVNVVVK